MPEFKQQLKNLEYSINRKIGEPIIETGIDTFEMDLMPYRDA